MINSSQPIFEILRLLSVARQPLGVKEISQRLELPQSTAHRGVVTLLHGGYVERYQSSATYVLGYNAKRVRQAFFARFRVRELALPYLQQIAFMTGETTSLLVPVGWYGITITSVRGTNEIISAPRTGDVKEMDQSFAAKVLLANLPEAQLKSFLNWKKKRSAPVARSLKPALQNMHGEEIVSSPDDAGVLAIPVFHSGAAIAVICVDGSGSTRVSRTDQKRILAACHLFNEKIIEMPIGHWNVYAHLNADEVEIPIGADDI
jgi:DNA-binding IclR family transcriptional regulator